MITRRSVLSGISAAGIGMVHARTAAADAAPLSVVVQINGQNFGYRQIDGTDLGDFVSTIGGFTQRCIRTNVAGSPLSVFFRPDRGSDRAEVVFELGRLLDGTAPAHLGAYTATVFRGDTQIASIDVPEHYWFSRWRWQSAPRPVVADVGNLMAQHLLPPLDRAGGVMRDNLVTTCVPMPQNPGRPPSLKQLCTTTNKPIFVPSTTMPAVMTTYTPYTVMGLAGVEPYMPRTGERDDIGLVTEPQAQFICTGSSVALNALFAQGEASGTVPWHTRDENTGAPINFRTYPRATWYWDSRVGAPWIPTIASPVAPDSAHQPALAYVPYMLTGDPYFLEELQFASTFNWGSIPPNYRPGIPQSRTFAWSMRSLAQLARVTPASVPSWLLPQAYWRGFLDDNRAMLETDYVGASSPVRSLFRSTADIDSSRDEGAAAPGGTWIDPWQDEFVASVMGWILSMGFTDWQYAYDWKMGTDVARTSTTSGWVRAYATPYRVILRPERSASLVRSWGEAWSLTQSVTGIPVVADPNTWVDPDMTYLAYTRGALAMAKSIGVQGVDENLLWATSQLRNAGWRTAYKWRIGTGL